MGIHFISRLLLSLLCMDTPAWATRRALLIEIGTYPAGRNSLHTDRDRYWLTQCLYRQAFTDQQTLQDHEATAQAIRDALDRLVVRCRPGDKVVIHYGGHGTQLPDQNGDEPKGDTADEALVPYDAPLPIGRGYAKSMRFIRDDELGDYLTRLRSAVGPTGHVLVLVDACHSGTLSRGQARLRTDNTAPARQRLSSGRNDLPKAPVSGWFDQPASTLRTASAVASVVLIAGAESGQSLYEVRDDDKQWVGPVAFLFSRAMELVDRQTTYQGLFTLMSTTLRQQHSLVMQNPTIEGDASARLLGGDLVLPSLLVRAKMTVQNQFRLMKGALMGYTMGAKVAVQVARGDGPAGQLTGVVVETNPSESVIQLSESLPQTDSVWLQTTLIDRLMLPGSARVSLMGFRQASQQRTLETALRQLPGIEFVADGADWLLRPVGSRVGIFRAADGTLLEQCLANEPTHLANRLMAYAQADWLRCFELPNSPMRVVVDLIPVRLDTRGETIQDTLPTEWRDGFPVIRTDQQGWLTVRNTGMVPCYFSLIDIQPNAELAVPLPNSKYPARLLYLLPGITRSFPLVAISPPLGLETYKLILSAKPIALQTLVQTRGARIDADGENQPLNNCLVARLRGSSPPLVLPAGAGTVTYSFWIMPKKY